MNELNFNRLLEEGLKDSLKKFYKLDEMENSFRNFSMEFSKEKKVENELFEIVSDEKKAEVVRQLAYTLGLLKANLDSLPTELATEQIFNNLPLKEFIKKKVNQHVDKQIKADYWTFYRNSSEEVCGFGRSLSFDHDKFKEIFPGNIHHFVSGFARGYSNGLHLIAESQGIGIIKTDPITQDIWKNWQFFLDPQCTEYSLEGTYIFPYYNGYNWSGKANIPYGDNIQDTNLKLYSEIRKKDNEFIIIELDPLSFEITSE